MAAMTNQKQTTMVSFPGTTIVKLVVVQAQSAVDGDTITIGGVTTVLGCWFSVTDGTQGSVTISGNIITIVNSAAKLWAGIVYGT